MSKPIPNVPKRCRAVYDVLRYYAEEGRRHGNIWCKELDLINMTGQSCAGAKLRELRNLPENGRLIYGTRHCRGGWKLMSKYSPLVITRHCRSEDGRRAWAEHRLSRSWKVV